MKLDGVHWDALCAEFEAALEMLKSPLAGKTDLWNVGPAGKWSAGQIVDHIATTTDAYATRYEEALRTLKAGALKRRPPRSPFQAILTALVIRGGRFPRGAAAPARFLPSDLPKPGATLERLAAAARRHRAIGDPLSEAERDQLWVPNPIWGPLSLPEMMRLQAVHARHHARQTASIARGSSARA